MSQRLTARAANLPEKPGVYLFKDEGGAVLYVGKAVNLRSRVRQYLSGHDGRAMVPLLLDRSHDIEVVIVDTEKEALILESSLIKQHLPRYNVRLRDDKSFLHLRLDPQDPWPTFTLVRQIKNDGARYFGPFHSAAGARQTLDVLRRNFPLRHCSDSRFRNRSRPCLLCQMGRCLGPCAGDGSREEYLEVVHSAQLFLEGRNRELQDRLRTRMEHLAKEERFEEAARMRDLLAAISATVERQKVVDLKLGDRDIWGLHLEAGDGTAALMPVRGGHMQAPLVERLVGAMEDAPHLLSTLLNSHYDPVTGTDPKLLIPPEILVPTPPEGQEALEEILRERRGARVRIITPRRGDRRRLVDLAHRNALDRFRQLAVEEERRQGALQALAVACGLPAPPHRIECFDNSNLQGADPVASMVVFLDGAPARREYRRYKVKTVEGPDDYATMREILHRRIKRAIDGGSLPDLLVVDGGRGQLTQALTVLDDLGIPDQPVVGLVKPHGRKDGEGRTEAHTGDRVDPPPTDRLVLPGEPNPVTLSEKDPALRLLQHLRDESHRYAVGYHRRTRNKRTLTSVLEALPGVGASRRQALLSHFGSARRLAEAAPEEIAQVQGIGRTLARRIHDLLHPS